MVNVSLLGCYQRKKVGVRHRTDTFRSAASYAVSHEDCAMRCVQTQNCRSFSVR